MRKIIAAVGALLCVAAAGTVVPASADVLETVYVRPGGNDGFSCADTGNACRQISAALTKVGAGGVIHVDPGDYAPFAVYQTVTIVVDGGYATIAGSSLSDGTNSGISVSGASMSSRGTSSTISVPPVITLRGFVLDTFVNGLSVTWPAVVHVEDCLFEATNDGAAIDFRPLSSGASALYISDSVVNGMTGNSTGVWIRPTGSASATAVVDNVRIENGTYGVFVDGRITSGPIGVSISNSTLVGNAAFGLGVNDTSGTTSVSIDGSRLSHNGNQGIAVSGASATVLVDNATITGNGRGILAAASGQLISRGGNTVAGNTVDGLFTATFPQN